MTSTEDGGRKSLQTNGKERKLPERESETGERVVSQDKTHRSVRKGKNRKREYKTCLTANHEKTKK